MRNKAKILGTIIGILLFVTLMAGITYAWYTWSTNEEEETLIATEVGTVTVKYDAGPSIIGKKIKPVSDKSLGIIKGITISADSQNVNKTVFDLYLDIKLLDDGLKNSSFKYELYESNNLRASGNFANLTTEECNNDSTVNHIVLLSEKEITMSISNYVLYIWIDGNEENPSIMQSQDFEFTLHAVGKNAMVDEALYPDITNVQEGTLAYKIVDDYISSENKTMVLNNNIRYYYDTNNSLMSDIAGNVRYYGNNPNNYIYFNCDTYPETGCETWRIIGVFDDKVKIMRVGSIGTFSWDTSASNANRGFGIADWNEADLMKLLNPNYEENYDLDSSGNSILVNNSLYWQGADGEAGYCYNEKLNSTTPCNLTNNGLKNTATRNMISDSLYYLDGIKSGSDIKFYVNEIYDYEKSGNTWYGKIALANVADLGYAADLNICKENLRNYFDESCFSTNWMFSIYTSDSWLLNSNSPTIVSTTVSYYWSANGIFTSQAFVGNNMVSTSYEIVPVLHLNANTVISNVGNGSEGNPYRLIVN